MNQPKPGYQLVRLESDYGDHIADVQIKSAIHPPEAISWNQRVFVFNSRLGGLTYAEVSFEIAKDL